MQINNENINIYNNFCLILMQVGIQEKTTFLQQGNKWQGAALFTDNLKIPAALLLLIAFTGILVLYHHVPPPMTKGSNNDRVLLEEEVADPEE